MVLAVDAKVMMQDMISGQAREAPRPLWGNKDPTALGLPVRQCGAAAGI